MINYCAFSNNDKCIKWTDYEFARHKLEEADELCHANWLEIQLLQDYINLLERTLAESGIGIPQED